MECVRNPRISCPGHESVECCLNCDDVRAASAKREFKAHKVMTQEEYMAMPIIGWHEVYRDIDGFGGVGVRFISCDVPGPLSKGAAFASWWSRGLPRT
jgi:hypothetical protein